MIYFREGSSTSNSTVALILIARIVIARGTMFFFRDEAAISIGLNVAEQFSFNVKLL